MSKPPMTNTPSPHKSLLRSRFAVVLALLLAAGVVQLGATLSSSGNAAAASRSSGTGTSASPSSDPVTSAAHPPGQQKVPPTIGPRSPGATDLQRGRRLYGASCAGCHGQNGEGSNSAPSLVGVGEASADFQLRTGRMPLAHEDDVPHRRSPAFDDADIRALVTYVGSLGGGPEIPKLGAASELDGRDLFLENCAACHTSSGVGDALPDGQYAPSLWPEKPQQVAEAIRLGPGVMPRFPESALDKEQMSSIVKYVGTLDQQDRGGWAIGRVGPASEGLVGWVLGLGLLLVLVRVLGSRAP